MSNENKLVRLDWREIVAFHAEHPRFWLKTKSGRNWCVRELMAGPDAKSSEKKVAKGVGE